MGLELENLLLLAEGRKNNPCRRPRGNWHYWKVYKTEVEGPVKIKRSLSETKQAGWYSKEEIKKLAERTERYLAGRISEKNWQESPGLEPVWYQWFKELKII